MEKRTPQIIKTKFKRMQFSLEPVDVQIVEERRARDGNSSQTAAVRAIIREWKKWDAEIKDGRLARAK